MWLVVQNSRRNKGQTIYLKQNDKPWLTKQGTPYGWTEKLEEAHQFAQKIDADGFSKNLRHNNARTVEYMEHIFEIELNKPLEEILTGGHPFVRGVVAKIVQKCRA